MPMDGPRVVRNAVSYERAAYNKPIYTVYSVAQYGESKELACLRQSISQSASRSVSKGN